MILIFFAELNREISVIKFTIYLKTDYPPQEVVVKTVKQIMLISVGCYKDITPGDSLFCQEFDSAQIIMAHGNGPWTSVNMVLPVN